MEVEPQACEEKLLDQGADEEVPEGDAPDVAPGPWAEVPGDDASTSGDDPFGHGGGLDTDLEDEP